MNPSRAGSSQGSSWTIFSWARLSSWPFSFSSENYLFRLENQPNSLILTMVELWWKIIIFNFKNSTKIRQMTNRFIKIGFKLDTIKKLRNFLACTKNLLLINVRTITYCQLGLSSKIEMPQLGSARNLPSSARLEPGNFSSGSSLVNNEIIVIVFKIIKQWFILWNKIYGQTSLW